MMPQDIHPEIANEQMDQLHAAAESAREKSILISQAAELAPSLSWLPNTPFSETAATRYSTLVSALEPVLDALRTPLPQTSFSEDFLWLHDNVRLIETELRGLGQSLDPLEYIPHVRTREGVAVPRPIAVAEGFLAATQYEFNEHSFSAYIEAFQEKTVLNVKELWALVPALKVVLLEQLAVRAPKLIADNEATSGVDVCIRSLREVTQNAWKEAIEPLIFFDRVLREDPAGAYAHMDFDSRELYRSKIVGIAAHSDCSEMEVAQAALQLAQVAARQTDISPRMRGRVSHVGYYLVAEGVTLLHRRVNLKMPVGQRIQSLLRTYPDEFYVPGIAVLTFAIMSVIVLLLTNPNDSLGLITLSMLALLLPASQSAVQVMNYLTTSLLSAQILPKLDFSEAVPDDCVTLVAIPTLLLNEKQVRRLVDDLEVRFLGNHDRNLHFALVSDLPDSSEAFRRGQPADRSLLGIDHEIERQIFPPKHGIVFSVSSPSHFQSTRRCLDGMGAQTWQAFGSQQASTPAIRQLPSQDWRSFSPPRCPLRVDSRFGHRVAARVGPAHDRGTSASIEHGDSRSREKHCGCRVWNFAASRRN